MFTAFYFIFYSYLWDGKLNWAFSLNLVKINFVSFLLISFAIVHVSFTIVHVSLSSINQIQSFNFSLSSYFIFCWYW